MSADAARLRRAALEHLALAVEIQAAAVEADPEYPSQAQMVLATVHVGIAQAAAAIAALDGER